MGAAVAVAELLPCLPITHHHPALGAGGALGRAAPALPAWAIGKLWPDLFLSAFDLCFVSCKALKRQIVTSIDLLFLLVWKYIISQQSRSYCFAAHPH